MLYKLSTVLEFIFYLNIIHYISAHKGAKHLTVNRKTETFVTFTKTIDQFYLAPLLYGLLWQSPLPKYILLFQSFCNIPFLTFTIAISPLKLLLSVCF